MKRILIKVSGEGLTSEDKKLSIDHNKVANLAKQVKQIIEQGIEVGIVVGGGNFWRGASAAKNGIPRNRADFIGMLATIMNGLALQSEFELQDMKVKMMSSVQIDGKVAENYVNEKAIKALANKSVVIFAGGTGRPYFTTDTAAALVASEIKADTILMGKNGVSGVYDSDPKTNPNAKRFDVISYDDIISKGLHVMDSTAASMAKDNNINLMVFDITEENSLLKAVKGEITHTKVTK